MNVATVEQLGDIAPSGERSPARALAAAGRARTLLGMALVNLLLAILTLGIYGFWGRTRIRRYLWGSTRLWGEPLEYTGTGLELLKGALLVALVLVPLLLGVPALDALLLGTADAIGPFQILLYALLFYLSAAASWRALGYRLSRTQWRGIRGHVEPGALRYAAAYVGWSLLSVASLWLTKPLGDVALSGRLWRAASFGTLRVGLEASGRDIWRVWLVCWLLLLPTLGMSYFWYAAHRQRYLWSRTTLGALRFAYGATGREHLWLGTGNILLLIVTLGLAAPVCLLRNLRLLERRLEIIGRLDPATLGQSPGAITGRGEGLASALAIDGL